MNNKTLSTGVKTREISIDGKTQILVSSPHFEIERKNLIGKLFTKLFNKEQMVINMLYMASAIITGFMAYFLIFIWSFVFPN